MHAVAPINKEVNIDLKEGPTSPLTNKSLQLDLPGREHEGDELGKVQRDKIS